MIELSIEEYANVLPLLDKSEICVSALSVIDGNQSGKVFADQRVNPASSLIINSYGQYLVAGSGDNEEFMNEVTAFLLDEQNHGNYYDLFATAPEWIAQLSERLAGKTVLLHRSSFTFDLSKFRLLTAELNELADPYVLKRVEGTLFEKYRNEMDFSYHSLWRSAEHFLEQGFGYCIMKDGQFASVCNSFFVGRGLAEIDIVTVEEYQQQGLATRAGAAFIEHCLTHNLVPHYNCDAGNQRSILLATKLGFTQKRDYPMLWWHQDPNIVRGYLEKYNYLG